MSLTLQLRLQLGPALQHRAAGRPVPLLDPVVAQLERVRCRETWSLTSCAFRSSCCPPVPPASTVRQVDDRARIAGEGLTTAPAPRTMPATLPSGYPRTGRAAGSPHATVQPTLDGLVWPRGIHTGPSPYPQRGVSHTTRTRGGGTQLAWSATPDCQSGGSGSPCLLAEAISASSAARHRLFIGPSVRHRPEHALSPIRQGNEVCLVLVGPVDQRGCFRTWRLPVWWSTAKHSRFKSARSALSLRSMGTSTTCLVRYATAGQGRLLTG